MSRAPMKSPDFLVIPIARRRYAGVREGLRRLLADAAGLQFALDQRAPALTASKLSAARDSSC